MVQGRARVGGRTDLVPSHLLFVGQAPAFDLLLEEDALGHVPARGGEDEAGRRERGRRVKWSTEAAILQPEDLYLFALYFRSLSFYPFPPRNIRNNNNKSNKSKRQTNNRRREKKQKQEQARIK